MPAPAHQCPRCDYDLSGQIAAWQTECPLSGQCPECGLTFTWSHHFNTEPPPKWSYEHARGAMPTLVGSFLRTFARAAIPSLLWSSLKMDYPIVPRRLVHIAIGGPALAHVLMAALIASVIAAEWWMKIKASINWVRYGIFGEIESDLSTSLANNWLNIAFPYATDSRTQAVPVDTPLFPAENLVLFAILLPAAHLLLSATMRRAKVRSRHLLRIMAYWFATVPALAMVYPIIRRIQSACFSVLQADFAAQPAGGPAPLSNAVYSVVLVRGPLVAVLFVAFFSWWFWSSASARYLRLPRARLDAALLVILAGLAALAIEFFISAGNRSTAMDLLRSLYAKPD